jgi:hypothetical protein
MDDSNPNCHALSCGRGHLQRSLLRPPPSEEVGTYALTYAA